MCFFCRVQNTVRSVCMFKMETCVSSAVPVEWKRTSTLCGSTSMLRDTVCPVRPTAPTRESLAEPMDCDPTFLYQLMCNTLRFDINFVFCVYCQVSTGWQRVPHPKENWVRLYQKCVFIIITCISSVYITFNSAHGLNKPLISSINLRNSNFLLVGNKTRQKKCIYFEGGTWEIFRDLNIIGCVYTWF